MLEKSKAYFEQGDFNKALELVTQCTNGDMQNKAAWELKIKILTALGRLDEADDCHAIVSDIQNKSQLKTHEKWESREGTPELKITLDLNKISAGQQLAAFINGRSSEEKKRLKRK